MELQFYPVPGRRKTWDVCKQPMTHYAPHTAWHFEYFNIEMSPSSSCIINTFPSSTSPTVWLLNSVYITQILTRVTLSEVYTTMAWTLISLPKESPVFSYKHFVNPWVPHLPKQVLSSLACHLQWLCSPPCSILTWKQPSFPWFPLNLLPQSIYVQSRLCWRVDRTETCISETRIT